MRPRIHHARLRVIFLALRVVAVVAGVWLGTIACEAVS
jgi:hypothetical protein